MTSRKSAESAKVDSLQSAESRKVDSLQSAEIDMRHIQYQGETLPTGISVSPGIR